MKQNRDEFRIALIIPVSIILLGLTIYYVIPSLHTFLHDYYWSNGLHMGGRAFVSKLIVYDLCLLGLLVTIIVSLLISNNKQVITLAIGISGGIIAFYLMALNIGSKAWIYPIPILIITIMGIYFHKKYILNKVVILSAIITIAFFTSWLTLPTPYHPIHMAVFKQDLQNVEKMLQKDPSLANQPSQRTGLPPLFNAGEKMTNLLLKYDADIHAKGAYYGESLLTFKNCSFKVAKQILEKGFDVDEVSYNGRNALFIQMNPKVVRLLLKAGANPNHQDASGNTALFEPNNSPDKIKFLIQYGADINHKNMSGETALFYARTDNAVQILLENGSDIYVINKDGDTAFHNWVRNWSVARWRTFPQLLSNFPDIIHIKNKKGVTPLDIVKKYYNIPRVMKWMENLE